MRCIFISALLLAFSVTACAQTGKGQPHKNRTSGKTTVTYCGAQKMDVKGRKEGMGAQAAILYVHGGGWETGERKGGFEKRRVKPLTDNEFIVATLDYRLAPKHIHPAQIYDVKCALKYLRANSAALGIDPQRIGVMGDSAGGHLAALAGLTSKKDGLEGPNMIGVPSDVKAIATFYGIFDLVNVEPKSLAVKSVSQAFPSRAARVQGSPVLYVDKNDPPILIMHGKKDRFVDVAQSVKLAIILKDAGHSPLLVAVENADHGFVKSGGNPHPNSKALDELLIAFFSEHLKK